MRRALPAALLLALCTGCVAGPFPASSGPPPVDGAQALIRAQALWRQGRFEEAYADFVDAAQALPGAEVRRFPEARWRSGPRMPAAHAAAMAANWAGTALAKAGDGAGAEAWYGKAIAADPSLSIAWRNRGMLRTRGGDLAGAREDLKGWSTCDPRYAPFIEDNDLLPFQPERRAALEVEAEAGWKAELEGSPLTAFRHYSKAYALLDLLQDGDLAEVPARAADIVRVWQKAPIRPTLPREGWHLRLKAEEAAKAGLHADAADLYGRLALGSPWFADAYMNRAMILEELREYPAAIETLHGFLDLFPDSPDTRQAKAKARSLRAQLGQTEPPCPPWKPWLGVGLAGTAPVPTVQDLIPGSPAELGGLKQGDRILKAMGEPVTETNAFLALVRARQPGQTLDLVVSRDGREVRLQIPVGHRALGR